MIVNLNGYNTTINDALVGSGSGGLTVTSPDGGSLILTGTNTYTGATVVKSGTLVLSGSSAWNPVVTLAGGADLQAGRLVFDYSTGGTATDPVAAVQADLYSGKIKSTTAASGVGIGYVDGVVTGVSVGTANQLILVQALNGDANLDGTVDGSDLTLLALNWKKTTNLWTAGDFNHDGTVDGSDLTLLALNWKKSFPISSGDLSVLDGKMASDASFAFAMSAAGWNGSGFNAVPEPGTLVLLLVAALGAGALWVRKRRG